VVLGGSDALERQNLAFEEHRRLIGETDDLDLCIVMENDTVEFCEQDTRVCNDRDFPGGESVSKVGKMGQWIVVEEHIVDIGLVARIEMHDLVEELVRPVVDGIDTVDEYVLAAGCFWKS
jgi:hypothetical protein